MAVPTITSIEPNSGAVTGQNVVYINGTNFATYPEYPEGVSVGPVVYPVAVWFNNVQCEVVDVLSSTRLMVRVPDYRGAATDGAIPAVSVVVQNYSSTGAPAGSAISGERATLESAYTYTKFQLHGNDAFPVGRDQPLTLVTGAFVRLLRRTVLENTVSTTHTDYGENGETAVSISKIPQLILQGPTAKRDVEYWSNEIVEDEPGDQFVDQYAPPYVVRLAYTIVGVTDNERELLNISSSLINMFERIKYLRVQLEPNNPNSLEFDYVLQLTDGPNTTNAPSDDNLRTVSLTCEVRGVPITSDKPFTREFAVTEASMTTEQIDG